MEGPKERLQDYVKKIHYFVGCLKNRKWLLRNDEETIDILMRTAVEIEELQSKEEYSKLFNAIKNQYPQLEFDKPCELLLEICVTDPSLNDKLTLCAIKKFINYKSKEQFVRFLTKLLVEKRLKEDLIDLSIQLSSKANSDFNLIAVNSIVKQWETANSEKLGNIVIEMLETETSLLLLTLESAQPSNVIKVVIDLVLHHLCNNPNLWFKLVDQENLKNVLSLGRKHSEFLKYLFNFLKRYSDEVECNESDSENEYQFKWNHSKLDFVHFIEIVCLCVKDEGVVGKKAKEFLDERVNNFDDNFNFWVDVHSLL